MGSTTIQQILESFDRLADGEKREVVAEIMRRTRHIEIPPISDEELVQNAEELFLQLDRREEEDGHI